MHPGAPWPSSTQGHQSRIEEPAIGGGVNFGAQARRRVTLGSMVLASDEIGLLTPVDCVGSVYDAV
jgi:hypothetical protein